MLDSQGVEWDGEREGDSRRYTDCPRRRGPFRGLGLSLCRRRKVNCGSQMYARRKDGSRIESSEISPILNLQWTSCRAVHANLASDQQRPLCKSPHLKSKHTKTTQPAIPKPPTSPPKVYVPAPLLQDSISTVFDTPLYPNKSPSEAQACSPEQ